MINIEELQAENRRLREELLRVKREVLETGVISHELERGDYEKIAVLLYSFWKLDAEALERTYRKVINANNGIKYLLGFPITVKEQND